MTTRYNRNKETQKRINKSLRKYGMTDGTFKSFILRLGELLYRPETLAAIAIICIAIPLLVAFPAKAADNTVTCDDENCVMSVKTLEKISDYIKALQDRVKRLQAKQVCT